MAEFTPDETATEAEPAAAPAVPWVSEPRDRIRFGAVVALGLVASILEALLLITIVPIAKSLITPDEEFSPIGPLADIADTPNRALVLAAVAGLAAVVARLSTAFAQARTIAAWEHRLRRRLSESYFGSSLSRQLQRRPEHMIELWSNAVTQSGVGLTAVLSRAQAVVAVAFLTGASFLLDARAALAVIAIGLVLLVATRHSGVSPAGPPTRWPRTRSHRPRWSASSQSRRSK